MYYCIHCEPQFVSCSCTALQVEQVVPIRQNFWKKSGDSLAILVVHILLWFLLSAVFAKWLYTSLQAAITLLWGGGKKKGEREREMNSNSCSTRVVVCNGKARCSKANDICPARCFHVLFLCKVVIVKYEICALPEWQNTFLFHFLFLESTLTNSTERTLWSWLVC